MPVIPLELIDKNEVARRVGRLQQEYAGNPLIQRIGYSVGIDRGGDPAIYIKALVARKDIPIEQVTKPC